MKVVVKSGKAERPVLVNGFINSFASIGHFMLFNIKERKQKSDKKLRRKVSLKESVQRRILQKIYAKKLRLEKSCWRERSLNVKLTKGM